MAEASWHFQQGFAVIAVEENPEGQSSGTGSGFIPQSLHGAIACAFD